MNILVIEDDPIVSASLAKLLAENHYAIARATDGQKGLDLTRRVAYDLIILDLQIPKPNGLSWCEQLRSQAYSNPILLLTNPDTQADVIAELDAGADAYLLKPYDPEVLLARIRGLFRHLKTTPNASRLTWGDLCLNRHSGQVTCQHQEIQLTATEYNLLELFLQNPHRIFSRSAILEHLWEWKDPPTERAIVTHLNQLHKKLKAGGLTADLIETIYGMGYRLQPAPAPVSSPRAALSPKGIEAVNRVIERFRNSFQDQIAILQQAKTALLAGQIEPDLLQIAKQEAHKLAGSLGSFGYPEGSKLARSVEHLLAADPEFSSEEIAQFADLVTALQQQFNQPARNLTPVTPATTRRYCVIVIHDDVALMQQLQAEAESWGIQIKIALELNTARSRLAGAITDAVFLDLDFLQAQEQGLTFLEELAADFPKLPIIASTDCNSQSDRLAVSRLGVRQFLSKPVTTAPIFQAIFQVLFSVTPSEAKVLIVDDDPQTLAKLSALLTPWGLQVFTLTEPQNFWQDLVQHTPDLILLDLEMPQVRSLELCQGIRQDAQWGDLPILVVTAEPNAMLLQQAFAAGADDFITKPVLGPELVSRILSRIERHQTRLKMRSSKIMPKEAAEE